MKVLIGKINASILFHCIKKDEDLPDSLKVKEKTRYRGHTLIRTPKDTFNLIFLY